MQLQSVSHDNIALRMPPVSLPSGWRWKARHAQSSGIQLQVPGFTYPVKDMYLEDVLKHIGYQDAVLAQQNGGSARSGNHRHGEGRSRAGNALAELAKDQREGIESAIMQAFLHGDDEHFDHLLEVSHYLSICIRSLTTHKVDIF